MTDITDAGPRLKVMNDRLEELRAAADQADVEYRAEIDRLKSRLRFCDAVIRSGDVAALTDSERAALHWFAHYGLPEHHAATLRGLLERMGGKR